MHGFTHWFQMLLDLVSTDDDGVCSSLLAAVGGSLGATVALIEADVTVEEALSYARVMFDLGQAEAAREVVREAVLAAFGVPRPPALVPATAYA